MKLMEGVELDERNFRDAAGLNTRFPYLPEGKTEQALAASLKDVRGLADKLANQFKRSSPSNEIAEAIRFILSMLEDANAGKIARPFESNMQAMTPGLRGSEPDEDPWWHPYVSNTTQELDYNILPIAALGILILKRLGAAMPARSLEKHAVAALRSFFQEHAGLAHKQLGLMLAENQGDATFDWDHLKQGTDVFESKVKAAIMDMNRVISRAQKEGNAAPTKRDVLGVYSTVDATLQALGVLAEDMNDRRLSRALREFRAFSYAPKSKA